MVYKCGCDPKAENERAIDRSRTQSTVQQSLSTYPTSAECEQPHNNVHHPVRLWYMSVPRYHVILGLVFKAHAATMHCGQRTPLFVFWVAACAPWGPAQNNTIYHLFQPRRILHKLCVLSPSQHVAHVFKWWHFHSGTVLGTWAAPRCDFELFLSSSQYRNFVEITV